METRKNNKHALVSFIVGILAIFALILFYYLILFPFEFFLIGLVLSILALVFGIIGLKRKENKTLSLVGAILGGLVILAIMVIIFLIISRPPPRPSRNARIMAQMSQIRGLAEIIYNSNNSSYERVRCSEGNEILEELCEDIELQADAELTVHSTKDEYCIYVPLHREGYYCISDSGGGGETETNPAESGYCDGITFNCPP